jgi:hypothetical protein
VNEGAGMDRWVFIHIMKTAGTSFRTMLEETPAAAIYPSKQELAEHPRGWYLTAPELLARIERGEIDLADRRFLCGHYSASLAERLPGDWRTVTFLRDPVRRSLSMIAHRHAKASRFNRFVKPNVSKYLDNDDFVARQIRNYQTKVFAIAPTDDVNGGHDVDAAAFERAKARLMAIDFVGLTEQYAQSISLFEAMSGVGFAPLPHANRSRGYAATEAEIERIRALVPYDIALYDLAREKLRAQLAAAA